MNLKETLKIMEKIGLVVARVTLKNVGVTDTNLQIDMIEFKKEVET